MNIIYDITIIRIQLMYFIKLIATNKKLLRTLIFREKYERSIWNVR